MVRCVQVCGSDNRMDCRDQNIDPLNIPTRVCTCGMPDLDSVSQPYFIVRGRSMVHTEMAESATGNLLVRERVRKILAIVAPDCCAWFPTMYKGTSETTPWSLAVPKFKVETATVDPSLKRCSVCNQPAAIHPGTHYTEWHRRVESEHDIFVSSNWGSFRHREKRHTYRFPYLSVRLFWLLRRLKARGLDEVRIFDESTRSFLPDSSPTAGEEAWISDQLKCIAARKISTQPEGRVSAADAKWFRGFLTQQGQTRRGDREGKTRQNSPGFKLPKSYREFLLRTEQRSFENVDEQDGYHVRIVEANEMDVETYRRRRLTSDDSGSAVDCVAFAVTEHGDCFCFDVRNDRPEFEVLLYQHEVDEFEPYSPNFVAFLRRLVEGASPDNC